MSVASQAAGSSTLAIQSHYDVGNDFYSLWLDAGRSYSCAMFDGEDDLESAQLRKLDWHLEHARVTRDTPLLDVGCGWGALLCRATTSRTVCGAVGLSLSAAQVEWVRDLDMTAVDVRLESWTEHVPAAPYGAIISIGAFEHFARLDLSAAAKVQAYRDYFEFCHRVLLPGSSMTLQTITYGTADRSDFSPFFATEVFPESDLPHLEEVVQAARGLFEIRQIRNDREHYAQTARHWLARLRARSARAEELVGTAMYARYQRYLELLVIGFHTGSMNLVRCAFKRIDKPARRPRSHPPFSS